ncbi:MAG: RluA family pseudouridine synthase, partial [Hyphococcus sp.]
ACSRTPSDMSGVQKRTVLADEAGMRLDRWFRTHFPSIRHGELEKLLRKGEIRVCGGRVKANRRLEAGEEIRIPPSAKAKSKPDQRQPANADDASAIREMVLFEDDWLLALNKPFGLAVQGGVKTHRHIDGMLSSYARSGAPLKLVHRIDKDTGGLLLVAKTRQAAQRLSEAFKRHEIDKTYWAVTAGAPRPRQGRISLALHKKESRKDGGPFERMARADAKAKAAITDYQIVEEAGANIAFVALRPVTGRTHQLRVHMMEIDCPIVGDGKYGGSGSRVPGVSPRLHLFCRSMTFPHPKTGKKTTLKAPLTGHMLETWRFFAFDQKVTVEWPEMQP